MFDAAPIAAMNMPASKGSASPSNCRQYSYSIWAILAAAEGMSPWHITAMASASFASSLPGIAHLAFFHAIEHTLNPRDSPLGRHHDLRVDLFRDRRHRLRQLRPQRLVLAHVLCLDAGHQLLGVFDQLVQRAVARHRQRLEPVKELVEVLDCRIPKDLPPLRAVGEALGYVGG